MADDHVRVSWAERPRHGRAAADLSEAELLRELKHLHLTRHEMFLHAPAQAMVAHSERQHELEDEYLRRHPDRDVRPEQLGHRTHEHG